LPSFLALPGPHPAEGNFSFTLSALNEGLALRINRSGQEAAIFENPGRKSQEEKDSWQSKL
jgi:hypothetical protein